MRLAPWFSCATILLIASSSPAFDGPFQAEPAKAPPPAALAAPVKETLAEGAVAVKNADGKPFATFWLRKGIPASAAPGGPKGAVLYPFLQPGELLGVLEFAEEGHDYRDQAIAPGVYTLRYGLQPVNGDHLGVSQYRDYALLVPAEKDTDVATLPQKKVEKSSNEAAGSNHPAVMLLVAAPADAKGEAKTVEDSAKNLWGLVLPLTLKVEGAADAAPLAVQLIISGAAMP